MWRRGLALLAGLLAIAMIGVGCGGSSDSDSDSGSVAAGTGAGASESGAGESESGESGAEDGGDGAVTESSVSKAKYVKKADAICKKATEELQADFATFVKENETGEKPDSSIYAKLLEEVVAPNISAEIEDLRQLEVPEGDAAKIEAMLAARDQSLTIAAEDPEAMIQNTPKVFGESSKLANEYGLKACGTR